MEKTNYPLVKQSKSYKLLVTSELEKKIRFLCSRLPDNEYSGTLFYKINGTFEDDNLEIIAVDFYLQDVGASTFTEFKNDVSLAGYMVDNDLLDCYQGLMHSHNSMATFFSGTDTATLQSEGSDINHFVSLIVNNAGTYSAAITRKVNKKLVGTVEMSYNSFEGESKALGSTSLDKDVILIEYFPLTVTKESYVEEVDPLEERLQELKSAKTSYINRTTPLKSSANISNISIPMGTTKVDNKEAVPYIRLSTDTYSNTSSKEVLNTVAQIITGNIFASLNANIDLNKWVANMTNVYSKRFSDEYYFQFWADTFIEVLAEEAMENFDYSQQEEGQVSFMQSIWASNVADALLKFPQNKYLEYFISTLERWML